MSGKGASNKVTQQKLSEDHRVIIRIWLPSIANRDVKTSKALAKAAIGTKATNIGHVSIQTTGPNGQYASLWPERPVGNAFRLINADYHSLVQDEIAEGGLPDILVSIYSLDLDRINKSFAKLREEKGGNQVKYSLIGEGFSTKEGHNCCSMVYHLLRQGGVDKLNAKKGSSMQTSSIEPRDFADFIKDAKRRELSSCPETDSFFKIDGEYPTSLDRIHETNSCCRYSYWCRPKIILPVLGLAATAAAILVNRC